MWDNNRVPKPLGPQFIRVHHLSHEAVPPHTVTPVHGPDHDFDLPNMHPDVIHAGTKQAAMEIDQGTRKEFRRRFLHSYDIPVSRQYSHVFGDDFKHTFSPEDEDNPLYGNMVNLKKFKEKMKGTQPGLFESVTGTPDIALESGQAVPYRNRAEDVGSISWMIPKSAVHRGGIRYRGVKEINHDNDNVGQ